MVLANHNWEGDPVVTNKFCANILEFISINPIKDSLYSIVFKVEETGTGKIIYLSIMINTESKSEIEWIKMNRLYLDNILQSNKAKEYHEKIEGLSDGSCNMFELNLLELKIEENGKYYTATGYRIIDTEDPSLFESIKIIMNIDLFVQFKLFETTIERFGLIDHAIFSDRTFKNIKPITIDHVKLDGSHENHVTGLVSSHYTVGLGPTQFKFNFLSRMRNDAKLINPAGTQDYKIWLKDFTVIDKFLFDGILYLLINNYSTSAAIKKTNLLKFSKEMYDKTNFVDPYKIYNIEEDKNNGE